MGFVAQEKEYPTRCVHLGLQFRTSNLDPVERWPRSSPRRDYCFQPKGVGTIRDPCTPTPQRCVASQLFQLFFGSWFWRTYRDPDQKLFFWPNSHAVLTTSAQHFYWWNFDSPVIGDGSASAGLWSARDPLNLQNRRVPNFPDWVRFIFILFGEVEHHLPKSTRLECITEGVRHTWHSGGDASNLDLSKVLDPTTPRLYTYIVI